MKLTCLLTKRIGLILMILAILTSACSEAPSKSEIGKLSVVATTTIVGDVVSQVAGDRISLTILLTPGADPHVFEPKPVHIAAIADADLVFANGAGLETFMTSLIQNAGGNARVVEVSEGIDLMTLEETHEAEEADHEEHGEYDPHVWYDPANVMIWVDNIARSLGELDPDNAEYYRANAEQYTQALQALDQHIQDIVNTIPPEKRLLVTDHLVFGYFAERYEFQVLESIIPGFSTLASPSAQELAALLNQIRQNDIQAIFVGTTSNPALAEQIAIDTGVDIVYVYTGELGATGQPADTYIKMMEYNAQAIANALK